LEDPSAAAIRPSRLAPYFHVTVGRLIAAPQAPAPHAKPGRCPWQRCNRTATDLVVFARPHPLAGQQRGYCPIHAAEAAGAPGATLAGGRPAQLTLPGIGNPAWP